MLNLLNVFNPDHDLGYIYRIKRETCKGDNQVNVLNVCNPDSEKFYER